jgi:hypothetical protein
MVSLLITLTNTNWKRVRRRGYALYAHQIESLRMKKLNVLLMIGNEVLEPATIVIKHFNYTHIKEKVKAKKFICKPPAKEQVEEMQISEPIIKWFETRGISKETLYELQITRRPRIYATNRQN